MKRRWLIAAVTSMALICAGVIVRTQRKNRQLAKRAAAYRALAEQGDAKSQFALGAMYYYGKGVPKNYVEAARWYLKSAEQGNVGAEYSIASIYCSRDAANGMGVRSRRCPISWAITLPRIPAISTWELA